MRPGHVIETPNRQPIAIGLFAGAGGFSCGFKQAGRHVIAAQQRVERGIDGARGDPADDAAAARKLQLG